MQANINQPHEPHAMDDPIAQIMIELGQGDLDGVNDSPALAVMLIVAPRLVFFVDPLFLQGREETRHHGAEERLERQPGARARLLQLREKDLSEALLMKTPMPILVVRQEEIKERLEFLPQRVFLPPASAKRGGHQLMVLHVEEAEATSRVQEVLNNLALENILVPGRDQRR